MRSPDITSLFNSFLYKIVSYFLVHFCRNLGHLRNFSRRTISGTLIKYWDSNLVVHDEYRELCIRFPYGS